MYNIKFSEKILKFSNVAVNKKDFHASKQAIALNSVDTDRIVISEKFRHNDNGAKYFTGYMDDDIIKTYALCCLK